MQASLQKHIHRHLHADTNKLMNSLLFLFLQDEMEGLDLEGKTVDESTDLLDKLYSSVMLVKQVLVQCTFNSIIQMCMSIFFQKILLTFFFIRKSLDY